MAEKKETKKTTGRAGRPKKTAEPKPEINEEIEVEAVEEDQEPVEVPVYEEEQVEEEPIKVEESETYIVSCKDPTHVLNVRSGPGKQFEIVTTIPNGSKVSIGEKKNGFGCLGPGEWVILDLLKRA